MLVSFIVMVEFSGLIFQPLPFPERPFQAMLSILDFDFFIIPNSCQSAKSYFLFFLIFIKTHKNSLHGNSARRILYQNQRSIPTKYAPTAGGGGIGLITGWA